MRVVRLRVTDARVAVRIPTPETMAAAWEEKGKGTPWRELGGFVDGPESATTRATMATACFHNVCIDLHPATERGKGLCSSIW